MVGFPIRWEISVALKNLLPVMAGAAAYHQKVYGKENQDSA